MAENKAAVANNNNKIPLSFKKIQEFAQNTSLKNVVNTKTNNLYDKILQVNIFHQNFSLITNFIKLFARQNYFEI